MLVAPSNSIYICQLFISLYLFPIYFYLLCDKWILINTRIVICISCLQYSSWQKWWPKCIHRGYIFCNRKLPSFNNYCFVSYAFILERWCVKIYFVDFSLVKFCIQIIGNLGKWILWSQVVNAGESQPSIFLCLLFCNL
jgi:hypothetical protein